MLDFISLAHRVLACRFSADGPRSATSGFSACSAWSPGNSSCSSACKIICPCRGSWPAGRLVFLPVAWRWPCHFPSCPTVWIMANGKPAFARRACSRRLARRFASKRAAVWAAHCRRGFSMPAVTCRMRNKRRYHCTASNLACIWLPAVFFILAAVPVFFYEKYESARTANPCRTRNAPGKSRSRLKCNTAIYEIVLAFTALMLSAALFCHAQSPVTVELSPQKTGAILAPDFVGLSFEMQYVLADTNGNHFFSTKNKPLIATFKTLGIKNLRVGGNTADRPTIADSHVGRCGQPLRFCQSGGCENHLHAAPQPGQSRCRDANGELHLAPLREPTRVFRHRQRAECFQQGIRALSRRMETLRRANHRAHQFAQCEILRTEHVARPRNLGARFCERIRQSRPAGVHFAARLSGRRCAPRHQCHAAARDKILSPAMDEHYAKFAAISCPPFFPTAFPIVSRRRTVFTTAARWM